MHNRISIEISEISTLNEFAITIQGVLTLITELDITHNEAEYSVSDVYMTISAILGYFNERIPGSLRLMETSPNHYTIQYNPPEELNVKPS